MARKQGRMAVLACAFACVVPGGTAAASSEMFFKLDGIPGESDTVGFENQIEIDSFSFGVTKAKDKPASFSDVNVTRQSDTASPEFMFRAASGAAIPSGILSVRRTGGDGNSFTYLKYCFTNLRVTSFSQGASSSSRAAENIGLSYSTVSMSSFAQKADGTTSLGMTRGWDLVRNLQYGADC